MNALLIHNYNVKEELIGFFSENASELHFDIPQAAMLRENYSFDQEAHRQLYQHFEKKSEYDVIFLPYTLSNQNYLEFTGLRIAAHIRFTEEFNNQFTPVVFIGPDKPEEVLKLSALGNIIFTPGFFSTDKQDMESLTKQYEWIQNNKPSISNEEFQSFVERINIEPPANYRSHHSVDNDWALLRWSQYIGCENEIDEVRDNLETGLYFKWLKAKYGGMSEIPDKKQFHIDNNANILLIDDEATKGWKAFYENFFNNSPKITFQSLDLDFNLVGKDEVIEQGEDKIYDWDPDIILLDLRLSDEDFTPDIKPTEMTGYQILEKAKAINSGIQVIITTASNKRWNYKVLQEAGADDFLMKSMESNVAEDISELKKAIEKAIKRKKYLKPINQSYKNALVNWNKYSLPNKETEYWKDKLKPSHIHLQVKDSLFTSFKTLKNENIKENYTIAVLQLFRVLEVITEYFIDEEGTKESPHYSFLGDTDIKYFRLNKKNREYDIVNHEQGKRLPIDQKAFNVYLKQTGSKDDHLFHKLGTLTKYRNEVAIHPNERQKEKTLEYLHEHEFNKFKKSTMNYFLSVYQFIKEIAS